MRPLGHPGRGGHGWRGTSGPPGWAVVAARRSRSSARRRPAAGPGSDQFGDEIAGGGGRLTVEHVEPDPQPAVTHRGRHRRLVHHLSTCGVDEHRSRLQPARAARRSTSPLVSGPSARCTLRMSARAATSPGVGASSIDTCRSAASTPSSRASSSVNGRRSPGEAPAPEHDVQAESGGAANHLLADAADAEQPQRLAEQAPAPSNTPSCSTSRARSSATLSGTRRSSARISAKASSATAIAFLPGTIRDVDATLRRRGDVDGVVARAGAHDQRQTARRRASAPSPWCSRTTSTSARVVPIASRKRIVFQVGIADDLAPGGLQTVDAGLLELVGDQNLHRSFQLPAPSFQRRAFTSHSRNRVTQ